MNNWFLIAGIFLIFIGGAHALGGERVNFKNLRGPTMPKNERAEFRASWHLFTVDALLSGAVLIALAIPEVLPELDPAAALFSTVIALRYGLHGLMWVINVLRVGQQMLWRTPQWGLMLVAASLALLGKSV